MCIRNLVGYITISLIVSGCSGSDPGDTYIRFTVDDQSFETSHATFSTADLNRSGWKFVEIAKDVTQHDAFDAPAASLQWRMELTDPMTLEGQTIALRNLDDSEMADPLVSFELPGDVTIANMTNTDVSVTITSIRSGTVEGSFRGEKLDFLAGGQPRTVDVSGTFRARLLD